MRLSQVLAALFLLVLSTTPVKAKKCGRASWYGEPHQGHLMANGKPFDKRKLTAASKTLPLGSKIKVSFKNKHVIVTITDRGPYAGGRVLDVSERAAEILGFKKRGTAKVCYEPI